MASGNQTINVFPRVVQGSGNDDTLINGGDNSTILGSDAQIAALKNLAKQNYIWVLTLK